MAVKIMCTGASGMLGREVMRAGPAFVHGWDHADLDITDAAQVRRTLRDQHPSVVINCAGLTKHRIPEPTDVEYRRANTYGPLLLARECDRVGARLIHVSTDCVFSGQRPLSAGPYVEADVPDATDNYGRSKAEGEVVGAPHLTVRCSFVGLGDRGLIAWLRGQTHVDAWMGAIWSGSTAPVIARALVELAQRPDVTGLMHLTNGEMLSKAELIEEIWGNGLAPEVPHTMTDTPVINRWLASTRDDVPVLPSLAEALREVAL